MNVKAKLLVFIVLVLPFLGFAQTEDIDEGIQFHSSELDRLRKEIQNFEKRIKQTAAKEKSTLETLHELDEEITLVRNLLYRLKVEQKAKTGAVVQTAVEIDAKERDYDALQDRYARRVVDVYKKGQLSDLEILLNSDSWRQAIYRSKYLKIISNYDRALGREIRSTVREINDKRASLENELKDMARIDREKSGRKKYLERRRRMRNSELVRLKRDRLEFSKAIEEREAAAKELEALMAELERERLARDEVLATGDFSALKGKLPWPVEGSVISHFGSQRNPELKTVTDNPGIDIKGKEGGQVRAVYDGIVSTVTYIRGYGNTIIIDHGRGFYTVYTHVADVEVAENSWVRTYDIIAHVGDSGSLEGAKLHFEIWGNRTKLNPETWLKKS